MTYISIDCSYCFLVGRICPLMQAHFLWPLLKRKAFSLRLNKGSNFLQSADLKYRTRLLQFGSDLSSCPNKAVESDWKIWDPVSQKAINIQISFLILCVSDESLPYQWKGCLNGIKPLTCPTVMSFLISVRRVKYISHSD